MIGTFQALLVALVAVLPGALYTIAREHRGAAWARDDAASQLIRFVGVSAAFHAVFAPITYWGYSQLIVTGALLEGRSVSWYWWPILLAYLVLPFALGEVTARSRRWDVSSRWPKRAMAWLVSLYTATSPEPRAWDRVFSTPGLTGWIRLQLKDGTWRGGPWTSSYASGFPEEQDLYLSDQAVLTEDGEFETDESGVATLTGWGLLIRWDEVRYLELLENGSA
jgi:hypothetical protein